MEKTKEMSEVLYEPSALRHAAYIAAHLVVPSVLVVLLVRSTVSPWLMWSLIVALVGLGICSFPRHYLGYRLISSQEGFEYRPWVGRRRLVRWSDVTAYRLAGSWARLINDEARVEFLFERPLLVQDAPRFRQEIRDRCGNARRLSLWQWMSVLKRSVREAAKAK